MWVVTRQHWCSALTLGIYTTEGEALTAAANHPPRRGEWIQVQRRDYEEDGRIL